MAGGAACYAWQGSVTLPTAFTYPPANSSVQRNQIPPPGWAVCPSLHLRCERQYDYARRGQIDIYVNLRCEEPPEHSSFTTGGGTLVKKIKPDGSKIIYIGGVYEVDKSSGGAVTGTKTYYPAAGAMRIDSTLYYVLKDHLGSASVVTNNAGAIVGEDRFFPFGETRFTTGTMFTDKLFTGQREITGLGIYHYGARFYSPCNESRYA